ncbi:MAG: GNAT family N-acetyltransferase [Caldilineaceae bacterium]|nr:GNAT family N-acetyltransferase [Caldilineaceae bacterium]
MDIAYLVDHPQHIPTLAHWQHEEWGHLNPGDTVSQRAERLGHHIGRPGIPMTLIALEKATVLGSVALVVNDLQTHPQLTPFLASVYVAPPYRQRGVASALVTQAKVVAQKLGLPTLYLITPDQQRLYARLGWVAQTDLTYRGEVVTLMAVTLASSHQSS